MSTVLQLSDMHFGTELPEVVEALLVLTREQKPDLLIISGDVTQRARRAQYDAALTFLERMPVPNTLVIPGNHDIPLYNIFQRFISPHYSYQRAFGSDLEPDFESEELLVLGVNTTRRSRHTVGRISWEQIDRVSHRLTRASPRQLRIVVTHQPVAITRSSDEKNLLRGREAAVHAWAHAGADLILAGHIHLPHVRPLKEVFPELPRPVWSVLAGTALSYRVRGDIPNSVNLIRYQSGDPPLVCMVERWDFHESSARFKLVETHPLHLHRK